MERQEIDYKKIAFAAEKIKQRGLEPSLLNLAEELGIVNNPPRNLSVLLEQWYHNQPEFQRGNKTPLSENINIKTNEILEKNLELEKSLSLLRATLESTADGIMMVNGTGQVVDWNQKFVEMWRIPSHMLESGTESIGFDYILEQLADPTAVVSDVQYLYQNPDWEGELSVLHFKDGRIFERYTKPQRVGAEIVGRVYSFRDITQKRLAEDELRIRERAIEASVHGVVIVDITRPELPIIYVNRAFERITGYNQEDIIGCSLNRLQSKEESQINQKRIELAIKELREETVEIESYRSSGEHYWCEISIAPVRDSFGKVRHYVCICNDTTQRREMEQQLVKQATHDFLTNLPNRVLLIDRVDQAILQARKKDAILAFLFLDLDRFKLINDSLGHSIGDKLLQAVSNRLILATSEFDTVCRLGGDEFVVLLRNINNEKEAEALAKMILESIEKPFQIDQHNLKVTGSIGISFYPKDGKDYETLMKNSDLSMYHAKDSGRNDYCVFEQEMNNKIINRMQLDSALHDAIKNNEFYLNYQPLMDLKTKRLVGFEALLRWKSKLLGYVLPMDFIGLAEELGLIYQIGRWVLEEACKQTMIWHQMGYPVSIAVNISGRQFSQLQLADQVNEVLQKTGLPAKYLELELTESLLVDDLQHTLDAMYRLKDMGISLVIDDFGTGYSSLSYLKQFPVDKLKIDKSFLTELVDKDSDAAIARAIIGLGHSLNLTVLAEGIETEVQRNFVTKFGCDYAQGYYYSRPLAAENLMDFMKKHGKKKK